MKLLIVTQKADKADTVLGFAHSWLREFSGHVDHLHVVAQYVGEHSLPENVTVHSLGKEKGRGPVSQILRFLSLIWSLRNEYDAVFVHMNPVWMVIGGPMWLALGKPRFLWYESRGVTWKLKLAVKYAKKVFSASRFGMPLPIGNSVVTGHGIDTSLFTPEGPETRDPYRLLSVGRITKVKRFAHVIDILSHLKREYRLTIVGQVVTPEDDTTLAELRMQIRDAGLLENVEFEHRQITEMPVINRQSQLFIHAASTAGVDKAVLEAMACGCIPVSSSPAFQGILPSQLCVAEDTLEAAVRDVLGLPAEEQEALRQQLVSEVRNHHSLPSLITRLVSDISA